MMDKVAIVTGAGTGIGQGIALELGKEGSRVLVHYHSSRDGAELVCAQIREAGGEAVPYQADLSRVEGCTKLVAACVDEFDGVDVLVNNSGISVEIPFLDVTEADWDRVLDTNLRSMFFCSQAAARVMIQRGGGSIVNLGSVHGTQSWPHFSPYAASKGGIVMLTRQLSTELAAHRIRVNCIAPGAIEVERYYKMFPEFDRDAAGEHLPWGRVGVPADIGRVAAFLASDAADFVTGQVLHVDGGQTAYLGLVPQRLDENGNAKRPKL
jgi:NAD(P)-dependent dehydrogenase (short-subunit alcohol dehydrogenase family)